MWLRKVPRPSNERDRAPSGKEWAFVFVYLISIPVVAVLLMAGSTRHTLAQGAVRYGILPWAFGIPLITVDTCLRALIHRYPQSDIWKNMWDRRERLMIVMFGFVIVCLFISINALEARYLSSLL